MGSSLKEEKEIRLCAFDFDGTTVEDGLIPGKVQKLFREFVEKGGVLTTATGRTMEGISSICEVLENSGITPDSGYPQFLISSDKFIYFLEKGKYRPLVKWNNTIYKGWYRVLPQILERLPQCEDELVKLGFEFQRNTPTLKEQEYHGYVAFTFSNVEIAEKALEIFEKRLSTIDGVIFLRNVQSVGMSLIGTGKGQSLNKLRERIGIPPQQVLAIGNSQNDLSMLDGRYGFRSATVSNAERVIKDVIRRRNGYIASQALGQGICEIMRKIVLID